MTVVFYQLNANHLLGDANTKTKKLLGQNHCKKHSNMERLSILIDKRQIDLEIGYIMKTPTLLGGYCGTILSTKQSLKHHMVVRHSEKVTTYQCSKCLTTRNRLDNIRRHNRKHPGQTNTPKTVMYEIKERSPEPEPKRSRLIPNTTTRTSLITRP